MTLSSKKLSTAVPLLITNIKCKSCRWKVIPLSYKIKNSLHINTFIPVHFKVVQQYIIRYMTLEK